MTNREGMARELHEIHKKNCQRMFSWDMSDTAWEDLTGDARRLYRSAAHQILDYLYSQRELPYKQEEIDVEILELVNAVNFGGIPTMGSCSGHNKEHGYIILKDERTLIILPAPVDKDYVTRELQFNQSIKLKPKSTLRKGNC